MAFSLDLRERVITAVDNNMHVDEAVKIFKVSRRVIYEWLELRKETGSLAPKSGYQKGHGHKITDWDQFRLFVEEHKYCTCLQMTVEWERITGTSISESVMLRDLKKIGYTSKKKHLIMPKQPKRNVSYFWKKSKK